MPSRTSIRSGEVREDNQRPGRTLIRCRQGPPVPVLYPTFRRYISEIHFRKNPLRSMRGNAGRTPPKACVGHELHSPAFLRESPLNLPGKFQNRRSSSFFHLFLRMSIINMSSSWEGDFAIIANPALAASSRACRLAANSSGTSTAPRNRSASKAR